MPTSEEQRSYEQKSLTTRLLMGFGIPLCSPISHRRNLEAVAEEDTFETSTEGWSTGETATASAWGLLGHTKVQQLIQKEPSLIE